MICHDVSFRHFYDCHSYCRMHYYIFMTLFLAGAVPTLSQLFCHLYSSSLVTRPRTRLSSIHRFVSFSLFQSLFRVPPLQTVHRLCSFSIRLHSILRVLHSYSYELHSMAPAPAAPLLRPHVRPRALGLRRAPSVLSRRPHSPYVPSTNTISIFTSGVPPNEKNEIFQNHF